MTQPAIFFADVNERQSLFHRRTILLGAFAGLGLTALGGRLAYLQLLETQRYEKLATSIQFNFKLLPAPRSVIVDRNGAVLAANLPGVTANMGEVRVYPYGGAFSHVIGYVAKVNREDLTPPSPAPIHASAPGTHA